MKLTKNKRNQLLNYTETNKEEIKKLNSENEELKKKHDLLNKEIILLQKKIEFLQDFLPKNFVYPNFSAYKEENNNSSITLHSKIDSLKKNFSCLNWENFKTYIIFSKFDFFLFTPSSFNDLIHLNDTKITNIPYIDNFSININIKFFLHDLRERNINEIIWTLILQITSLIYEQIVHKHMNHLFFIILSYVNLEIIFNREYKKNEKVNTRKFFFSFQHFLYEYLKKNIPEKIFLGISINTKNINSLKIENYEFLRDYFLYHAHKRIYKQIYFSIS